MKDRILPLICSFLIYCSNAEIRTYDDIILPSSSSFVSYTEGYIMAPGSVNLVDLRFESFDSFYGLDGSDNRENRHRGTISDNLHRRMSDGDDNSTFIDMGNDFQFEAGLPVMEPGIVTTQNPTTTSLSSSSSGSSSSSLSSSSGSSASSVMEPGIITTQNPTTSPSETILTPIIISGNNGTQDEVVLDEIEQILNSTDDDELVEEEIEDLLDGNDGNDTSESNSPSSNPTLSSSAYISDSDSNITSTVGSDSTSKNNTTDTDTVDADDFDSIYDHDDDNGSPPVPSAIELVFFAEPEECSTTRDGCDWTTLGIGASNEYGDVRWCCSEDAFALGFCDSLSFGKLIIQHEIFKGSYAAIHVPKVGYVKVGRQGLMRTEDTGNHVLIIANCGFGENVIVRGKSVWTSVHGFLPGDLWGEFEFFAALTFLYALILTWYGWKMHVYSDCAIPIQKWLLVTLLAGFVEVLFKSGDYWIWNEDGTRFDPVMYIGIFAGVIKRAISRALVLMVCLGWGVVRDSLGGKLKKIVIFLGLYVVTSSCRDIFTTLAITDPDLTTEEEGKVVDIVAVFTFVTATLDVLIYLWILDSINATIDHLETMSQHQKLKIMLRLRLILILSILFAVFWSIFGFVNLYVNNRILNLDQEWAVKGAWEVNYLFVLVSISFLWRPNERAKELAYVMELPSSSDLDDIEFDTNEGLQEDDDWDDNGHNDFSLDDDDDSFAMGEYGNGLRIEDGEHA